MILELTLSSGKGKVYVNFNNVAYFAQVLDNGIAYTSIILNFLKKNEEIYQVHVKESPRVIYDMLD